MSENLPKNQNDSSNQKISVSTELGLSSKICDTRCRICSSDHLKEIHDLKRAGKTHEEIVQIIKTTKSFNISTASLSRHFQNYQRQKDIIAAQIINGDMIEEATQQSAHTKALVGLINSAFAKIKAQVDAGSFQFDISDLDKLMKLRYQVLSGLDTDESEILAIFQKASTKFGLDVNQGVLFKPKVAVPH